MSTIALNTKYTRVLPCDLKPKALVGKGAELNNELAKIEMLEAEAKERQGHYKSLIEQHKKNVKAIRRVMDTGQENVEVEVIDIPNVKSGTIETHRLDKPKSHKDRIVDVRQMDLLEKAETSPEAQADAEALAFASGPQPRKAKTKAKAKLVKAEKPAKAEKPTSTTSSRKKSKLKIVENSFEDAPVIYDEAPADEYAQASGL